MAILSSLIVSLIVCWLFWPRALGTWLAEIVHAYQTKRNELQSKDD